MTEIARARASACVCFSVVHQCAGRSCVITPPKRSNALLLCRRPVCRSVASWSLWSCLGLPYAVYYHKTRMLAAVRRCRPALRSCARRCSGVREANEVRSRAREAQELTASPQELSLLFGTETTPDSSQEAPHAALSHVDTHGRVAMVDVGGKNDTQVRQAAGEKPPSHGARPSAPPSPPPSCCWARSASPASPKTG